MLNKQLKNRIQSDFGDILSVIKLTGGANHGIFKIKTLNTVLAVKIFNKKRGLLKEKYERELWGLKYFKSCGIRVPQLRAIYPNEKALAIEYIDNDASNNSINIDNFIEFVSAANIHDYDDGVPYSLGNGLTVKGTIKDCHNRVSRLIKIKEKSAILNVLFARINFGLSSLEGRSLNIHTLKTVVSAGDFGKHNVLISNGEYVFFDFEYCGFDDLSKLICDFILHPGHSLTSENKYTFLEGTLHLLQNKKCVKNQLKFFYELYSYRWALIVLNSFLYDFSDRVSDTDNKRNELLIKQLEKSETFIENAKNFPF